jgi:acetyl esterase/lipase
MFQGFFLALATLLFSFSALPYLELPSIIAWKFSLVATEFGHWLALLSLLFVILSFYTQKKSKFTRLSTLCLSVATVVFLIPSIECAKSFSSWISQLDQTFEIHAPLTAAHLDITRLYFGTPDRLIKPISLPFQESPVALTLDFYPAVTAETEKAPWVLVIHGGGWNSGQKDELPALNSYLANRGISVASISYRLAPEWKWPAPKEDALAAIRFLKSHSAALRIDPDRWAVLGRSAGGQIAEDLAYSIKDSSLKGCVALYAPADMDFAYQFGREDDILHSLLLLRQYMGGSPNERADAYRDASPIDWVQSGGGVPTLLLHGEKDTLVWHKQSERLLDWLKSAGVSATLISLPWATHGFDYNINGPGGQITSALTARFLKRVFQ